MKDSNSALESGVSPTMTPLPIGAEHYLQHRYRPRCSLPLSVDPLDMPCRYVTHGRDRRV
jgi:hypothetical protein